MLHTLLTSTKKLFNFGKGYTTDGVSTPSAISGGSSGGASTIWKDIARGTQHTVAVRADGTLWGWGKAKSGSIGNQVDNVVISSSNAVQIGSASDWDKVASGSDFSVGLKKDGTAYGWGTNANWQLGGSIYATSPYFASISTSDLSFQSIGLKTDGSIWVWGWNKFNPNGSTYSLGLTNTSTNYFTEPQLLNVYKEDGTTLETFKYVYVNEGTFYAITTEGRLYKWGYIGSGNNSYTTDYSTVPTLKDFAWPSPLKKIVRTNGDVLAITEDGKAYTWGGGNLLVQYNQWQVSGGSPTQINFTKSYTQFTQRYVYNLVSYYTQTTGPYMVALKFASPVDRAAYFTAMSTYNPNSNPIQLDGYNDNPDYLSSRYTGVNIIGLTANQYQYFDGTTTWYMVRYDLPDATRINDFGPGSNGIGNGNIRVGSTSEEISSTLLINDIAASSGIAFALTSTGKLLAGGNTLSGMPTAHTSITGASNSSRWTLTTGSYAANTFTYFVNDQYASTPTISLADGNYAISSIEQYIDVSSNQLNSVAYATVNIYNNTVSSITINTYGGMGAPFPYAYATFVIPGTITKVRVKLSWTLSQFGGGGPTAIPWINVDPDITYTSIDAGSNAFAGLSTNGGVYYYNTSSPKITLKNGTTSGSYTDSLDNSNFIQTPAYKISLSDRGDALKWILNSDKSKIGDFTVSQGTVGTQYPYGDIEHLSAGSSTYSASFYIPSGTSSVVASRNKLYVEGRNNYGVSGIGIDDGYNASTRALTSVGGVELTFTKTPLKISSAIWKDIAAGEKHIVAIDANNTLWGSGYNNEYQLALPATDTNKYPFTKLGDETKQWKSVYASGNASGAIDSSDKAFTWGSVKNGAVGFDANYDGHPTYATYLSAITQMPYGTWSKLSLWGDSTTGVSRNAGLTTDGKIYTWGSEDSLLSTSTAPAEMQFNGFAKLFSCNKVAYGIKSDGTLWAWGDNTYGQLGIGITGFSYRYPIQVGTSTWTKLSTNGYTTVGIRSNGTLWVWGSGSVLGTQAIHNTPYQISTNVTWTDIAVGGSNESDAFMLGLRGGSLIVRGTNTYGQLGLGNTNYVSSFTVNSIPGTTVTKIAVGYNHSAILTASGTLRTAGSNNVGQLGLNIDLAQVETYTTAVDSTTWSQTILSVAAGANNTSCTFGSTYKTLATTGDNSNYTLAREARNSHKTFYTVVSGVGFTLATDSSGYLWGWGDNTNGQLSELVPAGIVKEPVQIGGNMWSSLTVSGSMAAGISTGGNIYVWGDASVGHSGTGINSGIIGMTAISPGSTPPTSGNPYPSPLYWVNVKLGTDHALAVRSDGTLWAWGNNTYGQLGIGNTVYKSTPTQVGTDTNWYDTNTISYPHANKESRLSAGYKFSHAINRNGELYGWGYNVDGAVGDSTTTTRSIPTYIRNNMRMVRSYPTQNLRGMVAGISYSDLYLYTWGANLNLKLGHGQSGANNKTTPTKVGTSQWADVYVGQDVVIGLRAGSLYTWGTQSHGELGNGYVSGSASTPTIIDSSNTYTDISAGYQVMYALSSSAHTKAWGNNSNYALGFGDVVISTVGNDIVTPSFIGYNILLFDKRFEMTNYNYVNKVSHALKYTAALLHEDFTGDYVTVWGNISATDTITYTDHQPFKYEGITTLENTYGKYIGATINDITASADHVITATPTFYNVAQTSWETTIAGGELGTIGKPSTSPLSPYLWYDGNYDFTKPMTMHFYRNAFVQNKTSQYPVKLTYSGSSMLTDSNGAPFKDITTGKTSTASESLAIGKNNELLVWGTTSLTNVNNKVGVYPWYKLGKGGFNAIRKKYQ